VSHAAVATAAATATGTAAAARSAAATAAATPAAARLTSAATATAATSAARRRGRPRARLRNPAAPDPNDIKPRIQSWRAPKDGTYYIRVRDNLNLGGDNKGYTIVVQTESYGPTPVTITELCRDLFEEDGLPEQARLITSNESQNGRVLCPTGDADWVKFFALRGKVYYIYTDTRIYPNKADINGNPPDTTTEAGADTVIYLADRDGVSILDFNDDIEGSLDSQIRFTPPADGFYYLQVKNVGDIGNQFIEYDLTLTLCVAGGENCGRSPIVP